MTEPKPRTTVQLAVRIPVSYHIMLKKLAAEKGLTITDIFIQYLAFLHGQHMRDREILNARYTPQMSVGRRKTAFELLDGHARELERLDSDREIYGDLPRL